MSRRHLRGRTGDLAGDPYLTLLDIGTLAVQGLPIHCARSATSLGAIWTNSNRLDFPNRH